MDENLQTPQAPPAPQAEDPKKKKQVGLARTHGDPTKPIVGAATVNEISKPERVKAKAIKQNRRR